MNDDEIARRNRRDKWTAGEMAIQDAVDVVELMGAHPALTDAVTLLGRARDRLADFVDGIDPPTRRSTAAEKAEPSSAPSPWPWRWTEELRCWVDGKDWPVNRGDLVDRDGSYVADAHTSSWDPDASYTEQWIEVNDANARLIAAAPELLEALVLAVDHLDLECSEGFAKNNAPQRQRFKALIARVEGTTAPRQVDPIGDAEPGGATRGKL